ncbi:programmed cell death protein 7 [Menidia menidia]
MDSTAHLEAVHDGGYPQTQFAAAGKRASSLPGHPAPQWTPSPVSDPYGIGCDFSASSHGGVGYGGAPLFPPPYGFDPSVPPPPFGCLPPGHFPRMAPPAAAGAYSNAGLSTCQNFPQQFRAEPPRYDGGSESVFRQYDGPRDGGVPYGRHLPLRREGDGIAKQPEDEKARVRRQDTEWIKRFLQSRGKTSGTQQHQQELNSLPALGQVLYRAAELLSQLEDSCHKLQLNLHNDAVWQDSYSRARDVKQELQDKVSLLSDSKSFDLLKSKLSRTARRRACRLRARRVLQMEEKEAEERSLEKEAAIDKWRMMQIQKVEEKKKEQELKLAADAVLCEVRKKQADVKRMQDILRSLEKLRKLRKEAASRKGITTELPCDQAFDSRLEHLRSVIKRRTAVYSAEEKALMVMLEGEQEEERRREQERRAKKERERQMQRRRRVDAMLFGEELPGACILQPFTDYYSQAQHSLQALIQIRGEWDAFLVAEDHPEGSAVPQSWILPEPPSDQAWASALQAADCL